MSTNIAPYAGNTQGPWVKGQNGLVETRPKWSEMEVNEKFQALIESMYQLRQKINIINRSVQPLKTHTHDEGGNPVNVYRVDDVQNEMNNEFSILLDSLDMSSPKEEDA